MILVVMIILGAVQKFLSISLNLTIREEELKLGDLQRVPLLSDPKPHKVILFILFPSQAEIFSERGAEKDDTKGEDGTRLAGEDCLWKSWKSDAHGETNNNPGSEPRAGKYAQTCWIYFYFLLFICKT